MTFAERGGALTSFADAEGIRTSSAYMFLSKYAPSALEALSANTVRGLSSDEHRRRLAAIRDGLKDGKTYAEIGEPFGLSRSGVCRYLARVAPDGLQAALEDFDLLEDDEWE